jgi:hypothetical protein
MMYRLVFASSRRVPGEKEKGPWLPSKDIAEQWRDYFHQHTSCVVEAIEDSSSLEKHGIESERNW